VTARVTPNPSFCSDTERCLGFYRSLLDKLHAAPGVEGAALVNTLPLGGRVTKRSVDVENFTIAAGQASPLFSMNAVTPDYFRVMDISLLAGRPFTESELSGNPPVAILNEETARRFWPGKDPIGQHVRLLDEQSWRTVVGIAPDVLAYDLQRTTPDYIKGTVYVPFSPTSTGEDRRVPVDMTVAIRTTADPSQVAGLLKAMVAGLNHQIPISEVRTMSAVVSEAVSTPASTTLLFVAFAGLALLLGMVGIYGVLAFLVSKRTREIGIRIALGARRRDVLWLVLREGAKFGALGIATGLAGAFVVTRWISSELYGVSSADPLTFTSVGVLMALVTMLACYLPARRALAIDPLSALRLE
jgi:putative ABC transport system permease protein